MGVNHCRRVARWLGCQILIAVQREVIGAKSVAQSILSGRDIVLRPEFGKLRVKVSRC